MSEEKFVSFFTREWCELPVIITDYKTGKRVGVIMFTGTMVAGETMNAWVCRISESKELECPHLFMLRKLDGKLEVSLIRTVRKELVKLESPFELKGISTESDVLEQVWKKEIEAYRGAFALHEDKLCVVYVHKGEVHYYCFYNFYTGELKEFEVHQYRTACRNEMAELVASDYMALCYKAKFCSSCSAPEKDAVSGTCYDLTNTFTIATPLPELFEVVKAERT